MQHARTLVALVVSTLGCGAVLGCTADAGRPSGPISEDTSSTVTSAGKVEDSSDKKRNAETGCAKDDECESGICFSGGNQSFCTVQCTSQTAATDCAPPFTGSCNKRGYCKRD
jgi:hypothetical protein